MQDRSTAHPRLTLARAVYGFVIIGLVSMALMAAILFNGRSSTLLHSSLDEAVRIRTVAAGEALARSLHNDWIDLKFLADAIPDASEQSITGLMDGMRGDGDRISWIGYAGLNGEVLNASDGLLLGQDVSARPWFINGIQGPYAGDVHEALLLSQILAADDPAGLRFVDLAIPVADADGQITGVVAVHINFDWARHLLAEQAETLGLTLYLSNAAGDIIMATNDSDTSRAEAGILRSATSGTEAASREVWPDGNAYFASLVPEVTYRDLPNFGWRLTGRLADPGSRATLDWLAGDGKFVVAALLILLGVVTAVFVRGFVRPLEQLGATAERMADGAQIYPPDVKRTREMSQLSSALARLQSLRDT